MDKESLDHVKSAILSGRTDIVQSIISVCDKGEGSVEGKLTLDVLLNSVCCDEGSLLHLATLCDNCDIVRALLSAGANPNIQNKEQKMPFHLSISEKMNHVYIVELLTSAAKSNIPRINDLINSGLDVNSRDSPSSGNTALHWAASDGNLATIQCLLDRGAAVDVLNCSGVSPYHEAVARNDSSIMELLLNAGASPTVKCTNKNCSLCQSVCENGVPEGLTREPLLAQVRKIFMRYAKKNKTMYSSYSTGSSLAGSPQISSGVNSTNDVAFAFSNDSKPCTDRTEMVNTDSSLAPGDPLLSLWPLPHRIIQQVGESFKLKGKYSVHITQSHDKDLTRDIMSLWNIHGPNFSLLDVECVVDDIVPSSSQPSGDVMCLVNKSFFNKEQCYKLIVTMEQVRLLASDLNGLHYGICTFLQILGIYRDTEGGIPRLQIEDFPDSRSRGVLFDMTPDARKPNLITIKEAVTNLSLLKVNQIFFQFLLGPKGQVDLPYSNSELLDILEFCQKWFVVPVPAVDVAPEFKPESLKDCSAELRHLMSLFDSRIIHIGENLTNLILETFAESSGSSPFDVLSLPPQSLVYCCISDPETMDGQLWKFPMNVVVVYCGSKGCFEYNPCVKMLSSYGLPVIVAVENNIFGSIAVPSFFTATNVHRAAQSAIAHGAIGMVIADRGVKPHHPSPCFSWPGFVAFAGQSWNSCTDEVFLFENLPKVLNTYVFRDAKKVTGDLLLELGQLEACTHMTWNSAMEQSLVMHKFLLDPDSINLQSITGDYIHQSVRQLRSLETTLKMADMRCHQSEEIVLELQVAIDLSLFVFKFAKVMVCNGFNPNPSEGFFSVTNLGTTNLPPTAKTDLGNRLLVIVGHFNSVWKRRNLLNGLTQSLYLFKSLLNQLVQDSEHFFSSTGGFLRQ